MISILIAHLSTIIVSLILAGIVTLIIRKLYRDKKQGKTCGSCGDCTGCAGACGGSTAAK